jgi:hypothetical protein
MLSLLNLLAPHLQEQELYCTWPMAGDGHATSSVLITIARRFKSGDHIKVEHCRYSQFSKTLLSIL